MMLTKDDESKNVTAGVLFKLPQAKIPHSIGTVRDISTVKELCRLIESLMQLQRQESLVLAQMDLIKLATQTKQLWLDSDLNKLKVEAMASIVNPDIRSDILQRRIKKNMNDGRDLLQVAQQHKDEFGKFVSDRRQAMRSEMRTLFESGPTIVARLGDNISQYTKKMAQVFEQNGQAQLVRMGIVSTLIEGAELPGYYSTTPQLMPPRDSSCLVVSPDRLSFEFPVPIPASYLETWAPAYATVKFCAPLDNASWLKLADELLQKTHESIRAITAKHSKIKSRFKPIQTFTLTLAKVLDAVHPSHALLASAMSYPQYAVTLVKNRLLQLGYNLDNLQSLRSSADSRGTETNPASEFMSANNSQVRLKDFDGPVTLEILDSIQRRIVKEHRFVFEFTVSNKTCWRVGFVQYSCASPASKEYSSRTFPGMDKDSFGYGHDGKAFYNGTSVVHTKDMTYTTQLTMGDKTYAVLIDSYDGSVRILSKQEGLKPEQVIPAFGRGANCWDEAAQAEQSYTILNSAIVPMFALLGSQATVDFGERPNMSLNFGGPFRCTEIDAVPLSFVCSKSGKLWETSSFTPLLDANDVPTAGLHADLNVIGTSGFGQALASEQPLKSFSCFPPSFHKRTTAVITIQRAFRRWRGRRTRWKLLQDREIASMVIQRAARRLLMRRAKLKKKAATCIQHAWRRKVYVWLCLAKIVYQQPIPELHRAAQRIQRAWRNWHTYRNSPLCRYYNKRYEVLVQAANKIKSWWKQVAVNRILLYEQVRRRNAAILIQKLWRGYRLRSHLNNETRVKLLVIGRTLFQHLHDVSRVKAAYVLQAAVRRWLFKKLQETKRTVRNSAAVRIQALWRGFWLRIHCHLHLSYGHLGYLLAVRKNLKDAHYILKAYKPTGLVCPKE